MNPFESGERKLIPAVLVYVERSGSRAGASDREFLMMHRNGGPRASGEPDYHSGKWNGLGGKAELGESALETAQRELREESGLNLPLKSFRALGVLHFPNFKAHKSEDWICTVFTAQVSDAESRATLSQVDEGALHWVPAAKLETLNLWKGDQYFIPYVVSGVPFMGCIWYKGQEVERHWIQKL